MSNLSTLIERTRQVTDPESTDEGIRSGMKMVFGKLRKIVGGKGKKKEGKPVKHVTGKPKPGAKAPPKAVHDPELERMRKRAQMKTAARKKAKAARKAKAAKGVERQKRSPEQRAKARAEYMKKKPWQKKESIDESSTVLRDGQELVVLLRKGKWPGDMYTKGTVAVVVKGAKVGEQIKIKPKGDVMSGGHVYELTADKKGTFRLTSLKVIGRSLKVKVHTKSESLGEAVFMKKGEWSLHIYKSRATRWDYFLQNPQGGGGGMSSYKNIRAAFAAATRLGMKWQGKKKLWIVISKWDAKLAEYKATKSYWVDLPENGQPSLKKEDLEEGGTGVRLAIARLSEAVVKTAGVPMDLEGFVADVKRQARIKDRQLYIRQSSLGGDKGMVIFTLINLPQGVGKGGRGAEAMNNRWMCSVDKFAKDGGPPPTGKVKLEVMVSYGFPKMRGKTGTPQAIAKALAAQLTKIVKEVEPKFTHTKREGAAVDEAAKKPGKKAVQDTVSAIQAALKKGSAAYTKHFGTEVRIGKGWDNFQLKKKGGHNWLTAYLALPEKESILYFLIRIDSYGRIDNIYPEVRRTKDQTTMVHGKKYQTGVGGAAAPKPDLLSKPKEFFPTAKLESTEKESTMTDCSEELKKLAKKGKKTNPEEGVDFTVTNVSLDRIRVDIEEKVQTLDEKKKKPKPDPKAPVGSGGRFAALKKKLKGKVKDPGAVAAAIGRKKYGKKKFQALAAKGRMGEAAGGKVSSKKFLATFDDMRSKVLPGHKAAGKTGVKLSMLKKELGDPSNFEELWRALVKRKKHGLIPMGNDKYLFVLPGKG